MSIERRSHRPAESQVQGSRSNAEVATVWRSMRISCSTPHLASPRDCRTCVLDEDAVLMLRGANDLARSK